MRSDILELMAPIDNGKDLDKQTKKKPLLSRWGKNDGRWKTEGDIHSKKTKARCFGGEVGTDSIGGGGSGRGESPEFSCQRLECHLALLAWDDFLV